jgi:AbiV family abortive infection protein
MDDKEIEKGFAKVITNAKSLIEEAKMLLIAKKYARAYALAQLAIEEVGKSTFLCRAILDYYMGINIDAKYFDNLGFRKHQEKTRHSLKAELFAIWMFEKSHGQKTDLRNGLIEDFEKVEDYNNLKNNSLYVGITDDSFVSPLEIISDEMANYLVGKAELRLAAAEPIFRPLEDMKARADNLKQVITDSERNEALINQASEEFGIDFS